MSIKHFDVLVVGAGLSGIGAGYHLQTRCPNRSYAILESRDEIGGTWDLFRYPGIRSDSDMFTLGYSFRPWTADKSIADGADILEYVRDTAREFGIDKHIRFGHRVLSSFWSSKEACWTVEMEVGAERQRVSYTCNFLYLCSGYYSYKSGYLPEFPGIENYQGQVVHPQNWPEDLDYSDKRVVVIGSGATAVTLVPTLAQKAKHVTMLQRSPTYIMSLPDDDKIANSLRKWLPGKLAHKAIRGKNVLLSMAIYRLCRHRPEFAKRLIRKGIEKRLPQGYAIDTHFKPTYNPWDQRMCLVPNGDLFRAIRKEQASVVTDRIARFTEHGITTESGEELQADIVVTATGLKLVPCGGIQFEVDGQRIEAGDTFSYKGLMMSGMPNAAICVGYTHASWTLRADLSSLFVCRLLNYLDDNDYDQCTPRVEDPTMQQQPLLDLNSGYILRAVDQFPKQGPQAPWQQNQNYLRDLMDMKFAAVENKALVFSRRADPAPLQRSA
ncbi:MAG TPA: NAD(P)/FAD-dependent oxidoreductase [Pseudomonas xinjiangensis]|uniref:NAD(P)/FAD-dependent oxidoreductase n=2 Tax=root TaxID=1 RepID=A0A7V1BPY6_9GAMM|nr:NAD(P)/FAD-dependent oxidoreductase [Halopseudomonas xinjiangensis]HEC46351.1 NAD(P)/FAD-dependent oxidoreductase [Halopseudomonas xinjiangensis]